STPTVFSQVDLSRQSGPYAVNVRLNRQDQFLDVVDQQALKIDDLLLYRLPEVELRGRGIRLGSAPLYLSYQSSIDGLVRRLRTFDSNGFLRTDQAVYDRLDFFPTLSGSFTPVPWLDISPVVAFRETYYTSSDRDPGPALDPSGSAVNRQQYRLG